MNGVLTLHSGVALITESRELEATADNVVAAKVQA